MLETVTRPASRSARGVTLIELMVGIALLGIIATLSLPSFTAFLDRSRLEGAIRSLDADLQWARGEAVKRNAPITMTFTAGLNWSYALDDDSSARPIKTTEGAQFHNTTMNLPALGGGNTLALQPNRGNISTPAGVPLDSAVVFESAQGRIACVRFNPLGRTQLCSPAGTNHLSGVSECAC